MRNSKLGQSLMHTIGRGNNNVEKNDNVVANAFDQANRKQSSINSDESQIDESIELKKVDEPVAVSISEKPNAVKKNTKRYGGWITSFIAIIFSLIAIGIAAYTVVNQKSFQMYAEKSIDSIESMDESISRLFTKTDEIKDNLASTKVDVLSNRNQVITIESVRNNIQQMHEIISTLRSDMNGIKSDLHGHGSSIDKQQKDIEDLREQIKIISEKPKTIIKNIVNKAPQVKKEKIDLTRIEGAYVASIDHWGTKPYVMLREEKGSWFPVTMGDYYKGWKLKEATDTEAVFIKGSKSRRMSIKE